MTEHAHTVGDTPNIKRGLFWFRHDQRLHDNVGLRLLAEQVDELTMVYIVDDNLFDATTFGLNRLSDKRLAFLCQSLEDLDTQLQRHHHSLFTFKGRPADIITALLQEENYTHLGINLFGGFDERAQLQQVKEACPNISVVEGEACTLFNEDDLPFEISEMPGVFSPFRRKVEKYSQVVPCEPALAHYPLLHKPTCCNQLRFESTNRVEMESDHTANKTAHIGGEQVALSHLEYYLFQAKAAASYKETRNALDCWEDSTKLSPWLANGNLSPRAVMQEVKRFERDIVENESTYWIFFELLWREFFHWLQIKHGSQWFCFSGTQQTTPNTTHDPEQFDAWCKGETGYPIVDACMKQLNETGYMSNRGRQLVASCFVHELRQDWRYGAAYFEHALLDYDVGSNWGNWLYLAGVGSDPRGHRQFNLQKQTHTYDPEGLFRRKWLG